MLRIEGFDSMYTAKKEKRILSDAFFLFWGERWESNP